MGGGWGMGKRSVEIFLPRLFTFKYVKFHICPALEYVIFVKYLIINLFRFMKRTEKGGCETAFLKFRKTRNLDEIILNFAKLFRENLEIS